MRSQKGQMWSLDVVLAAVLFTLAMGLILSQTELNVFHAQQERNMRELHGMALLASNALVGSPEITITSPSPSSVNENIRCGPNPGGWSYEYDLSWMPNCIVDRPGTISPASLGLPLEYGVRVEAIGAPPLSVTSTPIPPGVPYYSVSRRMLVMDADAGAVEFHDCVVGVTCTGTMRDIQVTVWRVG